MNTQSQNPEFFRKIKSFIRRNSRATPAQRHAFQTLWAEHGIEFDKKPLDLSTLFQRSLPVILEIGFGTGQSLLRMAQETPDKNFIGIETHKPGVGALLIGIDLQKLQNLRVFYADAVEVIKHSVSDNSLAGFQIFFPDPWQKRRHHKRRLIQHEFVDLLVTKLQTNGIIHLATDWEDYAFHMMEVLSNTATLQNLAGKNTFSDRSAHRPIITKFEQRGLRDGRKIWELQFQKI